MRTLACLLLLASTASAQCPPGTPNCPVPPRGAAVPLFAEKPADAEKAINALRVKFGCKPMIRDGRLDAAARISVADLARTGRAHAVMDEAARKAGIPPGPKPPGGVYENFTEGAQLEPGHIGDYLYAMEYFARTAPREGHLVDFRNPYWTHFGFAEAPGGSPCVIWYGYFPDEVATPRPAIDPKPPATPPLPPNPTPRRNLEERPKPAVPPGTPPSDPKPPPAWPVPDAGPDADDIDATAVLAPTVYIVGSPSSAGSGVIVQSRPDPSPDRPNRHINTVFTVAHVVADGGSASVGVTGYRDGAHAGSATFPARVVRYDRAKDAAVLAFSSDGPMPSAPVDWSPRLRIGHALSRVGHGLGQAARLEFGHLTHLSRKTSNSTAMLYRISGAMYHGDSGGPVYRKDRLVALMDCIDYRQFGVETESLGYALPIKDAFSKDDLR